MTNNYILGMYKRYKIDCEKRQENCMSYEDYEQGYYDAHDFGSDEDDYKESEEEKIQRDIERMDECPWDC